ncbi:MAG: Dephospho-CoA kinase [Syntrophus sp. SKADARSKE-3]|nr:Dephospho-CoA kinase [Syntrophus sp. SKADARSKE-3]
MLNVGLTGGIASGKSTVASMLVEKGAVHIDFDILAHEVQRPGEPAWQAIVDCFGRTVLNDDGTVNRECLGAIVFQDREKLDFLGRIVHPAVLENWRHRLDQIERSQPAAIVLSDIPLLMERGMEPLFDLVVLVFIPPAEQIRRLMARNGYSEEEASLRLASQLPIEEKIRRADLTLRNEGTLEETRLLVDDLWRELVSREQAKRGMPDAS